jgi:hypothetical protein
MDMAETLAKFASKFVNNKFRERFLHEALNKPQSLHSRICHNINQVLKPGFADGKCPFRATDPCLILRGGPTELGTWDEATKHLGMGDGLLVIAASGEKFWAQTEAGQGSPTITYAAGS